MRVLFTILLFVMLMTVTANALAAQTVIACQDGLAVKLENITAAVGATSKRGVYNVVIGRYSGRFFEERSVLYIDGFKSGITNLNRLNTKTVEAKMLVPNGKCAGWTGNITFVTIKVTTK